MNSVKLITLSLLVGTVLSVPAEARSWVDEATQSSRNAASVVKDDMVVMRTDKAFKEVRVANAKIADVVVFQCHAL